MINKGLVEMSVFILLYLLIGLIIHIKLNHKNYPIYQEIIIAIPLIIIWPIRLISKYLNKND